MKEAQQGPTLVFHSFGKIAAISFLPGILDKGFWYLASPYSNFPFGLDAAHDAACELAALLMSSGRLIFCPIAHSHHIAQKAGLNNGKDLKFWLELDVPFMEAAIGMLIATLPGWDESEGIKAEVAEFERMKKPIYLVEVA